MSSSSAAAEIIAEQYSLWVSLLCSYAAFTLICYDWVLNLNEEMKLFWRRRVTAASILYFCIRYLLIVYWILGYPTLTIQGVGYVQLQTCASIVCSGIHRYLSSCDAYMYIVFVLQLLIYVFPALFSTLRVYALSAQNKVLALTTLFFSLGPLYANAVHYGWEKPEYLGPDYGCFVVDDATHQMGVICLPSPRFTGISRGLLSVGDLLVIVVTLVKTFSLSRSSKGLIGSSSLATTLLYSGVIYYIPLAILNILHTILTATGANQILRTSSLVSIFIDPVTSVLACRFLLNLRMVEEGRQGTVDESFALTPTLHFSPDPASTLPPFIASLGELVDMGFAHPEHPSADDSEGLEMTFAESGASDAKVDGATPEPHGEEVRFAPGGVVEEGVPRTDAV
ncbi:hypothetical protein LXA43DRAFT_1092096 [Ganoderma leucocontextum]|nr:hypothetical protein LXA43DRAFT_1092096 [Ganoderma leucocontextum]